LCVADARLQRRIKWVLWEKNQVIYFEMFCYPEK
jgi:hypothetical protein